ncbi:S-layer homology domain-containing protein [Desulfoscipio sp. XC116]|uniref:S-layer homology domain-containing protein n=1 Tax=Desulfoscipio sp. XC116 TaxID=3144975 RepID=UPI00325A4FFC
MNRLKSILGRQTVVLAILVFILGIAVPVGAAEVSTVITVSQENGTVPGKVQVALGDKFTNAAIVSVSGPGTDTSAVVAEGAIEFYASEYGDYTITDTQQTVRDCWMESMRTEDMSVGTYKGTGTATDPYTLLSTFADVPMDNFKLQAAWKGYNYLAGYPSMDSPNDSDYLNSYDESHLAVLLGEDRDMTTGRLRGSFLVDGSLWVHVTGNNKGPYYMNYLLDPTDAYLTSGYALDNHYLYSENIPNGAERKEAAVKRLKAVRDSTTSALFFNYRMRDFSGPIVFTVDVSESGKFRTGDVVSIHYLLGSSDRNLFHGLKPDPAALIAQEPTFNKHYQDTGLTATVDDGGYLNVTLFNGGYFELRNETSTQEKRVVTVKPKVYEKVAIIDVDSSHPDYEVIRQIVDKNYLTVDGGNFLPNKPITRGEYLKGLLLASDLTLVSSGKIEFTDVPKSSPLSDYVVTACSLGLVKGVSDTYFGVDEKLTREMAATMLCQVLSLEAGTDGFSDAGDISADAAGYPGAAAAAGYLTEYPDGSFKPQQPFTRAEAAVSLDAISRDRQ